MDPSSLSPSESKALAIQLRHPAGDRGRQVGEKMAELNAPANVFTLECLDLQPVDHVLEIGFGPGEALAEAVRLTPEGFVAGIDHAETMLSMARERNARAIVQDRLELTLGDAAALPYEDGSFDAVFAVNVFHFWEDPAVQLQEIRRVLKDGGRVMFFLSDPGQWPAGLRESGIFHARRPEAVRDMLAASGFRDVRVQPKKITPEYDGCCVSGRS